MGAVRCDGQLELLALSGVPLVEPGDDVGGLVCAALERAGVVPETGRDVIVVTSKVLSRSENRFVNLSTVEPSVEAIALAERTEKDPRLVELMLRESSSVSRSAKGVIVTRHRLGFVSANAGIDESNGRVASTGSGPIVLLLPSDPDASARAIRASIRARFGADIGIVITDSHGRPFRVGTVGVAIGVSGLPPLWDQCGDQDLNGRVMVATITAPADQIAAAADLVAGQANEGRPFVLVRGLSYEPTDASHDEGARALSRPAKQDLYV
jgi:coenzyme F420-0:L-glutamate ligase/coenzyme F420-1:gamma-L-glutamate ligase